MKRRTRYPTLRRLRRIRLRWHRYNRYWRTYGKCWECRTVLRRLFLYADAFGRNICWDCEADQHRTRVGDSYA